MDVTLLVVGLVLCMIGLVTLASSRRARSSILQRNFGFNIASTNTQTNTAGDRASDEKKTKSNWVGLAIAIIGFLTAVVGLFKH
jgi:hypothetical protein